MSRPTIEDYLEDIDLTVEPWATLAPLCWNEASPFRLGMEAEKHGVTQTPYTKPRTIGLFNEGRAAYRKTKQRFGGVKP